MDKPGLACTRLCTFDGRPTTHLIYAARLKKLPVAVGYISGKWCLDRVKTNQLEDMIFELFEVPDAPFLRDTQ